MAGEHDDAISRIDDFVDTVQLNSISSVVQGRGDQDRGDFVSIRLYVPCSSLDWLSH